MKSARSFVRCAHCGETYDIGKVTVIDRYADCSTFRTPCCNLQVDDRAWKSMPDFKEMNDDDLRTQAWRDYWAA